MRFLNNLPFLYDNSNISFIFQDSNVIERIAVNYNNIRYGMKAYCA